MSQLFDAFGIFIASLKVKYTRIESL